MKVNIEDVKLYTIKKLVEGLKAPNSKKLML